MRPFQGQDESSILSIRYVKVDDYNEHWINPNWNRDRYTHVQTTFTLKGIYGKKTRM